MPVYTLPFLRLLPAFAILFFITGCESDRKDAPLQLQIDELSLKVDSLMDFLELQRENDSIIIDESSVLLVPGDSSTFIKTELGYLTARLDKFPDFGNGSRVTFMFGNPGSVTLKGMRARLEWKTISPRGDTETQAPVRYEFLEDLPPGILTKIIVVLDDLPANRVVDVRISRVRFQEVVFKATDVKDTKGK